MAEDNGLSIPHRPRTPIRLSSWIGGDRDGNPNVTATITERVMLISRWQAADLIDRDLAEIYEELSVTSATAEVKALTQGVREPYRALLRPTRDAIRSQREQLGLYLRDASLPQPNPLATADINEPLKQCRESLIAVGLTIIANGKLLDLIRKLDAFGTHLVTLDVREEKTRHSEVIGEITRARGLGYYPEWSEPDKQAFLRKEFNDARPLIPIDFDCSAPCREVLNTFAMIARAPREALGCYVISMASEPSDILAVQLLLKATRGPVDMPVSPLFETLDDLDGASETINALLNDGDYVSRIGRSLVVMIGYSDSAKDAGVLFSLHLKATMMKISDPIIFGHAVGVYYADVFEKHGEVLDDLGVDPNNGIGDLYSKIQGLPDELAEEIRADVEAIYQSRPSLAMVNSDLGITTLHVPSDIIIDASMPVVVRDSGTMWGPDGGQQEVKCVIPDRCYAGIYQAVFDSCREHGAFDVPTMGNVSNVGLMAQKAEAVSYTHLTLPTKA